MKTAYSIPLRVTDGIAHAEADINSLVSQKTGLQQALSEFETLRGEIEEAKTLTEDEALLDLADQKLSDLETKKEAINAEIDKIDALIEAANIRKSEFESELEVYGEQDMTEEEEAEFVSSRDMRGFASGLAALADIRWRREVGGITVNGIFMPTERGDTRQNLSSLRTVAKEMPNLTQKYKTPDGFVELNAEQMIGLADAVFMHVSKCFNVEEALSETMDDFSSYDEIEAAFDAAYSK